MSKLVIRPLTPDLWPKLEDLFGPTGACGGCWCMYWRIGSAYSKLPRAKNKAAFKAVVKKGPPPGLLALADGVAVGWCQVTPRAALPRLERGRFTRAVDDWPVWSVSCFYVRKGWRGRGVMTALIDGALAHARKNKAPALEAYPVKTNGGKRSNPVMYTGSADSFARAGFKRVAEPAPHRPIMRYAFR
ncbi:MAG: GNAT family N-acetyltransferase [Alphaproteobacteria bacterium]